MVLRLIKGFIILHFSLICLNFIVFLLDKNISVLNSYFRNHQQEWNMFAPPPTHNTDIIFNYNLYKNGKIWGKFSLNILDPIYDKQLTKDIVYSKISYFLFNSSQNILDSYLKLKSKNEFTEKDINQKVSKTYDFKALKWYSQKLAYKRTNVLKTDSIKVQYIFTFRGIKTPNFESEKIDRLKEIENFKWTSEYEKIF